MNSIEINKLTKKFGNFISVNGISFNVKEGEIFGFLGANGAGKSTTIRMLCGILAPTSGDATVAGYSVSENPEEVKRRIGYMSQRFSLYNDLTIDENINFFGGVYGLSGTEFDERKKWVLRIADLRGKENILTGSLPGGIKQRLALGTAVIHRPPIVFLDEPTSGVDPISRKKFWELINELSADGTTLFVTTHYLEEAEYCNNIVLLDEGKIIAEGNSKELKEKYLKETIWEIGCDDAVAVVQLLENQEFTKEATLFGNNIHLIADPIITSESQLIELLKKRNIPVSRVEKIVPSLEDVFVHLLAEEKE
ncbi:MAG: ABC transporter ATP-binding protein [Chlorobi bacterium]|nr:ABC transporter ATP-binding protein [Chlorobiota bacterium]